MPTIQCPFMPETDAPAGDCGLHDLDQSAAIRGIAIIGLAVCCVPGNYTIVDHALTRLERGLAGILSVEGPPNPDIYNGQMMSGMGH